MNTAALPWLSATPAVAMGFCWVRPRFFDFLKLCHTVIGCHGLRIALVLPFCADVLFDILIAHRESEYSWQNELLSGEEGRRLNASDWRPCSFYHLPTIGISPAAPRAPHLIPASHTRSPLISSAQYPEP